MCAASGLPPEEHHHCSCLGGGNPHGHSVVAAGADCMHQEEKAIVSGSPLPPSFEELMSICTEVAPELSADPGVRRKARTPTPGCTFIEYRRPRLSVFNTALVALM